MIDSILGTYHGPTSHGAAIRCGHFIMDVRCTDRSNEEWAHMPAGIELRIYTQLEHSVQTGKFTLVGFRSEEERILYRALCWVQGIGMSKALGVLEAEEPLDVLRALASRDTAFLMTLPGVGPATAGKLVEGLMAQLPSLPDPLPVPVGSWASARHELMLNHELSFAAAERLVAQACEAGARKVKDIVEFARSFEDTDAT